MERISKPTSLVSTHSSTVNSTRKFEKTPYGGKAAAGSGKSIFQGKYCGANFGTDVTVRRQIPEQLTQQENVRNLVWPKRERWVYTDTRSGKSIFPREILRRKFGNRRHGSQCDNILELKKNCENLQTKVRGKLTCGRSPRSRG